MKISSIATSSILLCWMPAIMLADTTASRHQDHQRSLRMGSGSVGTIVSDGDRHQGDGGDHDMEHYDGSDSSSNNNMMNGDHDHQQQQQEMGHHQGNQPDLVTIDCDASYECDLRGGGSGDHHGGGGGQADEQEDQVRGTFVCRSWTHPITGDPQSRSICIPKDSAWTTDICGCSCNMDEQQAAETTDLEGCPVRPDFTTLECDASTQPEVVDDSSAMGRAAGTSEPSRERQQQQQHSVVCRNLVNPFTGDEQATSLWVPDDRGLEGDTCGCCDSTSSTDCPPARAQNGQNMEEIFPRPDFVEKSCGTASDAANTDTSYVSCDLRPAREQDQGGGDPAELVEGFVVCRQFYDPRGLGGSQQESICISSNRAWETDTCGCCVGEDGEASCPDSPRSVDIDCSTDTTGQDNSCQLQSGEDGVFVCRSLFHPMDGQVRERGFCIPSNRAWVTDVCGCCEEEGCPTPPEDGNGAFAPEPTQLAALALEVPDDYGIAANTSTDSAFVNNNSGAIPSFVGMPLHVAAAFTFALLANAVMV